MRLEVKQEREIKFRTLLSCAKGQSSQGELYCLTGNILGIQTINFKLKMNIPAF